MKIADFRKQINSLQNSLDAYRGHTADEFLIANVRLVLAPKINKINESIPSISPRFSEDVAEAERIIFHAREMIFSWVMKNYNSEV